MNEEENKKLRAHIRNTLSYRELQVLTLIAQHMKRAEIAAQLNLATSTVSTMRARAFRKLTLRDSTQVAVLFRRAGLVRGL